MSTAARHAAYFVKEVTYGTTPANPAFKRLRHTGLTLGVQRGSLLSEEMRSDRQIADFRLGTVAVTGDVKAELSYGSFDDLLEAVLLGTWTPKATLTATTLSAASADDSFNHVGAGFVAAGFEAGDVVTVAGFATGANNGTFMIDEVTAGKLTMLDGDGTALALTTEAAGESVTITTTERILKAGTVRRSFSVLRHFTDIEAEDEGKPFHLFTGVEFNTLGLTINPTAIVGLSLGVLGQSGATPANAAPDGATFAAASETTPMDAFTGELTEGGTAIALVTEMSFQLDNGLEARNVVGSKNTIRPGIGRSNLTGSLTAFFEDSALLQKFINETESSIIVQLDDFDGNSYFFEVPKLKFTAGQPDVASGEVTLSLPFQAIYDSATETNLKIRKIPVVA